VVKSQVKADAPPPDTASENTLRVPSCRDAELAMSIRDDTISRPRGRIQLSFLLANDDDGTTEYVNFCYST
jgi:hypothetical protein